MTISTTREQEPQDQMDFPEAKLSALEEKISHPRWVVPVLPDQELEALLIAATKLASTGADVNHPACQRFYTDALTVSFTKILTDDAVSSWKGNIQQCVRANCQRLVKLCAMKMDDPRFLHLLAMAFNPNNKFHSFNASRCCDIAGVAHPVALTGGSSPEQVVAPADAAEEVFARPHDLRNPRGWLVDLINIFGAADGFVKLGERFEQVTGLTKAPPTPPTVPDEVEKAALEDTEKEVVGVENKTQEAEKAPAIVDVSPGGTEKSLPQEDTMVSSSSESVPPPSTTESLTTSTTTVDSSCLVPPAPMSSSQQTPVQDSTQVVAAWQLIRPVGLCHELLTPGTITKYLLPILECVPRLLDGLSDEELKREARGSENKTDTVSCLIRACKCLSIRTPQHQQLVKDLEMFRLKMILRLLQMSSFNGKMSALNEINQVIGSLTQQPKPEWLTPGVIATWIRDNNVLEIVLRDSLHQPQYVERLEKMLRFMIKEGALTLKDLDAIWRAQQGKHEAIVKNLHDLLAKLAWDFSPDQLDHLFDCFKASWSTSSRKQSDKLLEVIRRLAEDDKDGVMAHKVLVLFWNLAHSEDVCTEVMDVALANLVKILDYSCSQDRDAQKTVWLDKCVDELKSSDTWSLPALKVMREICCLYEASGGAGACDAAGGALTARAAAALTRQEVIERLQSQHSLVILVTDSLTEYMERARTVAKQNPRLDWDAWLPDGRYPHAAQVQERLSFLRFLLKDGQLWLCAEQAKQIWVCLAERPASPGDREACFRWFSKLMGEEPDLDPGINLHFFRQNIMTLEPRLLTHSGIKCFERFFKAVNSKEGKLKIKRRSFLMDDADLIGLDYLWRVITECTDEISARGIELLREVCAAVGPRLGAATHHENFLTGCCARLQRLQRNLSAAEGTEEVNACCIRMCRVLRAMQEYVNECDRRYVGDRQILPMYRAGRGRHCSLVVRFSFQAGQRQVEDMELYTHSNETLQALRNTIQRRLKCTSGGCVKLELYVNGEILDSSHDRKLLSQIPIRDKTVLAGKVCMGSSVNGQSSNDSSSDSSTGSPPPPPLPETSLPGVILARGAWYIPFILELEQQGVARSHAQLRDAAHTLTQIAPAHQQTMEKLSAALISEDDSALKQMLYGPSPPTVAYNVEVLYSMVMPAAEPLSERWRSVQLACVRRAPLLVDALTDGAFLRGAPHHTRRVGYLSILRLAKLVLTALGHLFEMLAPNTPNSPGGNESRTHVEVLREALQAVPNQNSELMVKAVAEKLAQTMAEQVVSGNNSSVSSLLAWRVPAQHAVRSVCALALAAAQQPTPVPANLYQQQQQQQQMQQQQHQIPQHQQLHPDDVALVRECMELVRVCVALGGGRLDTLLREPWWQDMAIQLMIVCPSAQVRVSCAEQLLAMCAWGGQTEPPTAAAAALDLLLPAAEGAIVARHARHAHQFMQLLCRLVALAGPAAAARRLAGQVAWLRAAAAACVAGEGEQVDDTLLEGHLSITKEIFLQSTPEVKYDYGTNPESPNGGLVKELVCTFLWPYSWAQCTWRAGGALAERVPPPVCRSPAAQAAACDLLAALAHGCPPNMAALAGLLTDMFYAEPSSALSEWEYAPSVGPRSPAGLVGLKNAGATCYMNSVLQQLYAVPAIRDHLLSVQGAATDPNEDFSGEELQLQNDNSPESSGDYNVCILKQVQAIFAHLHYSRLQYYVPRGLWTHFKLQGEPVNLREQQDAVEFFMSLVESLDEALKTLGQEQLMAKTLGGSYSDQKICKGCPHRYCKEEPFSVVSLDIRNMSRLQESLEAYVRGELLEGADAYHCDKCNKKVVTVKRLCLNKLPPVLAIQLKRFEYDFEKVCAIKFNDYFEFPRELDVEPYTVWGLAKAEGDSSLWEGSGADETRYCLSGIVVHSGQASGGHYYSYVLQRDSTGASRWMKLDDGDVSECAMQDDEEMKAQCFGGEYMGEVFDPMLKRVSYRRQKRWWNAYMLFYTRRDTLQTASMEQTMANMTIKESKVPRPIWDCVRRGNIAFSHHQDQFSAEHFNFMKKLCCIRLQVAPGTQNAVWGPEQEELSLLSVQLATRFLFHVGFRTKKTLRGPASDWYDILCQHLRYSQAVRAWFAINAIFQHPQRLCEYLLACPSTEVRLVFMKIIVFLAHFSMQDPPVQCAGAPTEPSCRSLSDQVLVAAAALAAPRSPLPAEQHARHLPPLFSLFHAYAQLGIAERHRMLRLNVLYVVLSVCLDEGMSAHVKYQYPESAKIHQVVSVLVRCCDVSAQCQSSASGAAPLPNPYAEPPPGAAGSNVVRPQLSPQCVEILFNKTGYVKKLIEECSGCEDAVRLIQFLSWENPAWSRAALAELLWQMAYAYCHELRRHADTLHALLLVEDSWHQHRVHNAIKGVSEERVGLLETAARSRGHYQKRAYACIKLLVGVACRSAVAARALRDQPDVRRRWRSALAWLQDELDRRYGPGGYTYSTWSPPGTSNETSSGYFLERSNSARKTLERAYQLCPDEEEEDDVSDVEGETDATTARGCYLDKVSVAPTEHTTPGWQSPVDALVASTSTSVSVTAAADAVVSTSSSVTVPPSGDGSSGSGPVFERTFMKKLEDRKSSPTLDEEQCYLASVDTVDGEYYPEPACI